MKGLTPPAPAGLGVDSDDNGDAGDAGPLSLRVFGRAWEPSSALVSQVLGEDVSGQQNGHMVEMFARERDDDEKNKSEGEIKHAEELRKLNQVFLKHFIDLVDQLIDRPAEDARKVEDMGNLVRNMHWLLNDLRRYQGRITLASMLRTQNERRRQALAHLKLAMENAQQNSL